MISKLFHRRRNRQENLMDEAQLKALTDTLTAALKPVTDQLSALADNQRVLADTLKQLPPAPTDAAKSDAAKSDAAKSDSAKSDAGKPEAAKTEAAKPEVADASPSLEQVKQMIAEQLKLPGSAADGGTPPARQPVDYSKLPASQRVKIGVEQLVAGGQSAVGSRQ